ncbi:MAG: hypothetical protein IJJ69_05475 [Oscillospiraceae bacterium]|nr:hypothetical protein [Oscillospiraceae bacterium]
MRKTYQYKCKKCGYEKEFFVGSGFFTDDWKTIYELKEKLANEIFSGKYGEYLKKIAEVDIDALHFHCSTELFQCLNCHEFIVMNDKEIIIQKNNDYKITIDFKKECPYCHSSNIEKSHPFVTICPKCKEISAELTEISRWD